jgi:hypothetical protein
LTKEFIIWYLNDFNLKYAKHIDCDCDYKVEIIDNNVNKIEINSKQYIKIRENDYLIYNKIDIKN